MVYYICDALLKVAFIVAPGVAHEVTDSCGILERERLLEIL